MCSQQDENSYFRVDSSAKTAENPSQPSNTLSPEAAEATPEPSDKIDSLDKISLNKNKNNNTDTAPYQSSLLSAKQITQTQIETDRPVTKKNLENLSKSSKHLLQKEDLEIAGVKRQVRTICLLCGKIKSFKSNLLLHSLY